MKIDRLVPCLIKNEQGETIDTNETTAYNYDNKGQLANCISCIGNSIKSNIDSLKKAISQAVEKAKTKTLTNKTEKHHIIPKGARRTGNARNIWTQTMKLSINDKRNLVTINYNLHKVLHTKAYYTAINNLIVKAYQKRREKGVLSTVALIKIILATTSYRG